ncbi:MAG: SIMPL domain-containing protein, partial [Spirochaetales bacterium]|nr:SIMPL domain-containing protein [Spirochaetales bacterium]
MKNKKIFILFIYLIILGTQVVFASDSNNENPRTITITGHGSASAAPDIVRLNLGVESYNSDLNMAITDNNDRINKIISVIKKY